MFNIGMRMLKNKEDAEDVVQESFVAAFKSLKGFKYECSFGAWLKRIVINKSINHLKQKGTVIIPVNEQDYIYIKTEIGEKNTGFLGRYFEKVNPFDYNESNLKINYTLYVPEKSEITLINSFGDVVVTGWTGNLKTIVEHGDIWINNDSGMADIDLKYGKLKAKAIEYGDIRLQNGELDLETSARLRLNSSGSKIKMVNINSLEVYSDKDQFFIQEVDSITGA